MDNLLKKAMNQYFEEYGTTASERYSQQEQYDGVFYVVLRNTNQILCVYSVDRGDEESDFNEIELTEIDFEEWPEELQKETV